MAPLPVRSSLRPVGTEIRGDLPNYTDVSPVLQISEVVVERS